MGFLNHIESKDSSSGINMEPPPNGDPHIYAAINDNR